jgi:hypothetical protein
MDEDDSDRQYRAYLRNAIERWYGNEVTLDDVAAMRRNVLSYEEFYDQRYCPMMVQRHVEWHPERDYVRFDSIEARRAGLSIRHVSRGVLVEELA